MKVYRSNRQLLADIGHLLATCRPSARHSPLQHVIDMLCRGRHYAWVGIFLAVEQDRSQHSLGAGGDPWSQVELPETRPKILISMKLSSREVGVLSVESHRENGFSAEDRVLLENVAHTLARFLVGRGKYLARRVRVEASWIGRARTQVAQSA